MSRVTSAMLVLGWLSLVPALGGEERPRAVVMPPLDATGRLQAETRARLEARLRAALAAEGVVRFEELPGGPPAEDSWRANARRFAGLQAAGITYAVQLLWVAGERDCELTLSAIYLPSWDRGRYAHSAVKALPCASALEPVLDELVRRLAPALAEPPSRAVQPPDPGPPVVAVFLMESKGSRLETEELVAQTGGLSASLAESGKVRVLTRDEIRARILGLSPRKGDDMECFERTCFLRLSKEIEADYAVFSTLSRVGSTCMLQVQAFDVDRAVSVAGVAERSACEPVEISAMVARSGAKLERALRAKLPPAP